MYSNFNARVICSFPIINVRRCCWVGGAADASGLAARALPLRRSAQQSSQLIAPSLTPNQLFSWNDLSAVTWFYRQTLLILNFLSVLRISASPTRQLLDLWTNKINWLFCELVYFSSCGTVQISSVPVVIVGVGDIIDRFLKTLCVS